MILLIAETADILVSSFFLFAIACGPFVVFAIVVHLLESTIQRSLAERFGWKSVMWTGWLGTPIHELSHAAMCVLFRHKIDEISLFEPDSVSGRLGYVRHSWRKGNWFEELGNVFIGIAPLLGGSIALCVLLLVFFPDAVKVALLDTETTPEAGNTILDPVVAIFAHVLNPANLLDIKFWVFLYLVLCVASHMAPSWSDYQGVGRASFFLALLAGIICCLVAVSVSNPIEFQLSLAKLLSPLFAVLAIAAVLCGIATLLVTLVVSRFPKRYIVR